MLLLFEKGVDKFGSVEELQIGHLFSHADVFDRNFELVRDPNYHPTFGSAIQFGDSKSAHLCGFGKFLGPVSYTHLTLPTKRIV